jgi:hypothetical protein
VVLAGSNSFAQPNSAVGFLDYVSSRMNGAASGKFANKSFDQVCPEANDKTARRVLAEYGAVFAASEKVTLPPVCIFVDEVSVREFQSKLNVTEIDVNGSVIRLQTAAAKSMQTLLQSASVLNVSVRPLDGSVAGGRDYADTKRIWLSRVDPALEYWTRRGKITEDESYVFLLTSLKEQIERIIGWEESGLLFGTGRAISIFTSTAPPGTSQHISLIAFDVAPPVTSMVRMLFNANGWYQTVKGDAGHFTYLGVVESDLPKRGLRSVLHNGTLYWVPNIENEPRTTPLN